MLSRSFRAIGVALLALGTGSLSASACSHETFSSGNASGADAAANDAAADAPAVLTCPGADLGFDATNCGRCGRQCGSGSKCVERVCLPVKVADVPGPQGLWSHQNDVWFTSWETNGGLFRVDKSTHQSGIVIEQRGAWDITGNDDVVEWTNWGGNAEGGGVYVLPFATNKMQKLFAAPSPREIARDADGVYFIDDFENAVSGALASAPTSPYPIAPHGSATLYGPSTDKHYAYWASVDERAIKAAPKAGSGSVRTTIDVPGYPSATLVDGDHIYVAYSSSGDASECPDGAVARATLVGDGTATSLETVASGQHCPTSLVADAGHVYWVENAATGALRRADKSSLRIDTIIENRAHPIRMVVDDAFAWWVEGDTRALWVIALP